MEKRRWIVLFAIIAAIIVIVPVSLYELSDLPGAKIISVRNGTSRAKWYISPNNNTDNDIVFQNISSNSTFTSSDQLNSSLHLSFNHVWGFCSGDFYTLLIDYFNISGVLRGDLKPTGITVTEVVAAQVPDVVSLGLMSLEEKATNTSLISGWNFYSWNNQAYQKTNTYVGASICNVSLRNDSATQHTLFSSYGSNKNLTYSFGLSNGISLWLFRSYDGHNVTKYVFSLSVSIDGLGKNVQTQIIVEIARVGG